MAQKHPEAAVYVAKDAKSGAEVSFDWAGRKLDSLGHVVWGDRQNARAAGAKVYERPKPEEPVLHLSDLRPAPAPAPPSRLTSMVGGNGPATQPARSSWDNSILPEQRATAPGGYNPYRNRSFPPSGPPSMADITNSPNRMHAANSAPAPQPGQPSQWRPPWDMGAAEDFMAGRNPYSPVQPKVNIPGVGQLPASIQMQTEGLNVAPMGLPEPARGPVYEPYQGVQMPVTNPLDIYRQGVNPTLPPEPVGPQNYGRPLDVSAYMPGGPYYNGRYP